MPELIEHLGPLARMGGATPAVLISSTMHKPPGQLTLAPERFGIGASLPRVEDLRLLRGAGRYVDDLQVPGAVHLVVVRSPHAAAEIKSIDTSAAKATPGVIAVLTGADAKADGIGLIKTDVPRKRPDGSPMIVPPFASLATDSVCFVGHPVAAVVAETIHAALDAADLVAVKYDERPSMVDIEAAARPGSPLVWPGVLPDNVAYLFPQGDKAAVDAAFARADHVCSTALRVTRVTACAMEPRKALGIHDPVGGSYTLYVGGQGAHRMRNEVAAQMGVPPNRLRVVCPDVGGGFGMKGSAYPEYALVLWAARKVGRPVRWAATRTESFLSDSHGRDNNWKAELALAKEGAFLALRVKAITNIGACMIWSSPLPPINNLGGLAGTYRTPHIYVEVLAVHTNTQTIAPYRGAGRPEVTYVLERVIDIAADELGIDRVELRRRNLIAPDAMPFKTGLAYTYDSGEFGKNMDIVLEAADWKGFAGRRAESKRRGKLRGIGIVNSIEIAGGPFLRPMEEGAEIRFDAAGDPTLLLGSHNHGQGHETAFRQILVSLLGVDPTRIRVVSGDTDALPHGMGTFGSRSMMAAGTAMAHAADKIIARGRTLASHLLEAGEEDIEFANGSFRVSGTDREVRIEEVARASYQQKFIPAGQEFGLSAGAVIGPSGATFPNGCHVCEVEVDPETGTTQVVSYSVVDDVGTMINPLLVKGQTHGGIAQGVGQALFEIIQYDSTNGQIVTASFLDYALPRADDLPSFNVIANVVPTPTNPIGVKGAGEAGTVGGLPVVLAAVLDALKPLGVTHLDMPATPERVWAAIQAARAASPQQTA
jgi:carbon-monoxide dehydrogenase large subunit